MLDVQICIVGGCGHVGLPLGMAFAKSGAKVSLLDIDAGRTAAVSSGRMPFVEEGADELLPDLLAGGKLLPTTNSTVISQSDVVIVTVGTPVDEFLDPSIRSFDRAMDAVLDRMQDGQLLILRSTVFPGVTDRLVARVADRGLKIDVAYCPERIAQGYALQELSQHPQIVGASSPQAARRAADLFQKSWGVNIFQLKPVEAELAKLFANAYRYINFATSNQFYLIAESFGANFAKIREAVRTDYPRMKGFAGAGFAAGPCLLKDTMQLAAFNHSSFVLGQAAMMINEGLPKALVEQAKAQHDLRSMTAGLLGMAFKGDSDDIRDSLSYKLRKLLTLECREVLCNDPYVAAPDFVPLEEVLERADIIFLGAMHRDYALLKTDAYVVDVFNFSEVRPLGRRTRRAA